MYVAPTAFDVVGRLRPGMTLEQASGELNAMPAGDSAGHPDGPVHDAVNLRPLLDAQTHGVKTGLYALLGATGCLLLDRVPEHPRSAWWRGRAARGREGAIRTGRWGEADAGCCGSRWVESTLLSCGGRGCWDCWWRTGLCTG